MVEEKVDDVQEAEKTVLVVVTNGNKIGGNPRGDTKGVLDIQVLQVFVSKTFSKATQYATYSLDTCGSRVLRVLAVVEGLCVERCIWGDVRAERRQKELRAFSKHEAQ